MITINTCVYCSSMGDDAPKKVVIWEQTGEAVCYNCRLDLLDQEFVEPFEKEKKEQKVKEYVDSFNDFFKESMERWGNVMESFEKIKINNYLANGGDPKDLCEQYSKSDLPAELAF